MSAQLDLLAGLSPGRRYVDELLARKCCASCGADAYERPLMFVHRPEFPTWVLDDVGRRRPHPFNHEVNRLLQAHDDPAWIAAEVAKCDVLCRRCALRRVRPQMLRAAPRAPVVMVAKRRSTTCRGENVGRTGKRNAA